MPASVTHGPLAAGEASPGPEVPRPWLENGLTPAEVEARVARGDDNRVNGLTSQSWAGILRRNAFTRLNFLLLALGGATLATGSAPDATFLVIALLNTVVGAVEEARAKRKLEALAIISTPQVRVVRDGRPEEVAPDDVVIDDLLELRAGDQLPVDAVVVGEPVGAELDESLATGESDSVAKAAGDLLTSGSWVVAGALEARVTAVGSGSYANRLAAQARRYDLAGSELMAGINQILRWLSGAMVLIAPVLFVRELQTEPWRVAVRLAVAGLVGMVPEGLVLLTTLAFLAAAVRLARRRVLLQELPAVETLARVDALCVDKTGTLTEGGLSFDRLTVAGAERSDVEAALRTLGASPAANSTLKAVAAALPSGRVWDRPVAEVAFDSARKWSGATFAGHGTWVVGAPEVVTASDPNRLRPVASRLAGQGSRVLVVASGPAPLDGGTEAGIPQGLTAVGVVVLRERIRPEVRDTLAYFADQGVTVRVISGDHPATVSSVAGRVGLPGAERAVDARTLARHDGPLAMQDAVETNRVFGRVTPDQKQEMVKALQAGGHTVAMTGDGVNDVLALKDADLGVAMGSGSAVTRGVAQLVLLDDDFDTLPSVVAEGRRVLGNIELVAVLFLVKNVYSLILSVVISITGWPYPFLPRHLTLISAVGIGIPGFFLALGPNERRFRPGFLRRVLVPSVLAGTVTATAVLLTYAAAREEGLSGEASRVAAIIVTVIVSLWVLWIVAKPAGRVRVLLVATMAGLFVAAFLLPGVDTFFSLEHRPGVEFTLQAGAMGAGAAALIYVVSRWGPVRRAAGP
ncbi:MAG TPA: HAD-IC family P-type ATPase [Acidimicrobiales bacterium]|nr:HAD-IC family P-type ATPase [Acidimicrobiales bacterium]